MFCPDCGMELENNQNFCGSCGTSVSGIVTKTNTKNVRKRTKNPTLAALLSAFIIGLGQLYNGQWAKAWIIWLIQIMNIMLMFVLIGFFFFAITWIWSIDDAYKQAGKINAE